MGVPHYGGSLTSSGRLGRRPGPGTTFAKEVFLERLVRFDLAKIQGRSLLSDQDISKVLGKSTRAINSIRSTVPYLRKRMEITTGIGTDVEGNVEITIAKHRQLLKMAIPDAMRAIFDAVRTPNDAQTTLAEKKFKVEVARDILDREGTFPKISRTDSHLKIAHDFSSVDGVSKELLDSMSEPIQDDSPTESILQALAANQKFTNSETLSSEEMEASMARLESMPLTSKEIN